MSDKDEIILTHYKTVGRDGKQMVQEQVKSDSDSARFLLRMELRRLATPCHMSIDMRGKVADQCEPYQFQNLTHYLDEKCIEIFENEASRYDGRYTVGVFESVMGANHTHKALHEKDRLLRLAEKKRQEQVKKVNKDPLFAQGSENNEALTGESSESQAQEEPAIPKIELIPFGYRSQRKEKRLNYVTALEVKLPNNQLIQGKTHDISITGVNIGLIIALDPLPNNSTIELTFTQLSEQLEKSLPSVQYRLISQEQEPDGRAQLRLVRLDAKDNPSFNQLLEEFIQSYRTRYKIELEDNLLSLMAKVFERIYTAAAPIQLSLLSIGQNQPAQTLYTAIRQGEQTSLHRSLFSSIGAHLPDWLPTHIDSEFTQNPQLLLETFLIKTEQNYQIYCAQRKQLVADGTFDRFLKVGSRAHLIARILVTIQPVNDFDVRSTADLLAPLNETSPIRYQTIEKNWHNINHVAYLSIIEEKQNPDSSLQLQSEDATLLKSYLCHEDDVCVWQLGYRNERQESRFQYATPALIVSNKQQYEGNTLDFSPSGLKIQLDKLKRIPRALEELSVVKINLPEMQKLAKKTANLSSLSYRVTKWHPHQKAISLKRDLASSQHDGEKFFKKLIESNRSKLQECPEDTEFTCLAEMMESMVNLYLPGLPLFIHRFSGGRYSIHSAAATENANPLIWQFKQSDHFDFTPLNLESFFAEMLRPNLNRKSQLTKMLSARLFVQFPAEDEPDKTISVLPENELEDKRDVARNILRSRKDPYSRVFRATFLPPPYLKLEEFKTEFDVIRHNAANRARDLETQVSRLVAVLTIEDITYFYSS